MPGRGQQTACFLVECEDELIMLDAGTGTSNLAVAKDALSSHDHLSIVLSHYHLDHTVGLMYLKRFCKDMHIDVYGPGRPVYSHTTAEMADLLLNDGTYSSGSTGFAREVRYHDYGGKDFSIGSVQIEVAPQRHSAPSFQLRVQDKVLYCTDTSFDAGRVCLLPPTRVLLHECWQADEDDVRHTSVRTLAAHLPVKLFECILLIHHNPGWSASERDDVARVASTFGAELAKDGMCIEL